MAEIKQQIMKVKEVIEYLQTLDPDKNIWVYTGYVLIPDGDNFLFANKEGETFELPWLEQIDVLVDGRFEAEIRKLDLQENKKVHWRGSSNQRVIDVQKSILTGSIVCKEV